MSILLNGQKVEVVCPVSMAALCERFCPEADVLLLDGAPVSRETDVCDDAEVVLFCKGKTPSQETLEALMMARHTPGVHVKVKQAHVLVCGIGGLGSVAALALARTGVGTLTLVDYDVVEPTNLNRQQFFMDQLGMPKVEALADTIRRVNPFLTVRSICAKVDASSVADLLDGVDVVLECFDAAEAKAMLLEGVRAVNSEMPIVMASGVGGYDDSASLMISRPMAHVWVVGDGVTGVMPGRGLMAPRVGVAAAMQANLALRILLGEEE